MSAFRLCCVLALALPWMFLAGCASSQKLSMSRAFNPVPEDNIVYVVPFTNSLVPHDFSESVFNDFIDDLNASRQQSGIKWFYILKEDMKDLDPAWLTRQVYITGELWSYIEDSGCCSTELRAKARLRLYEAEQRDPTLEVLIPIESFFEHDRATLAAERQLLAQRMATQMANAITGALANRKTIPTN